MWTELLGEALRARPDVETNSARCRAVLNDLLGTEAATNRRQVRLLALAVDERVPGALIAGADPAELTRRFASEHALEPEGAQFAVATWHAALFALGTITTPLAPDSPQPGDLTGPATPVPEITPVTAEQATGSRSGRNALIGVGLVTAILIGVAVMRSCTHFVDCSSPKKALGLRFAEDEGDDGCPDGGTATPIDTTTVGVTATTQAEPTASLETPAPTGGGSITIKGFAFTAVDAAPGATVQVTNDDATAHTVTADDGSFDVKVDAGGTASFTAVPGTYSFHCDIHNSMTGTLVVG